MSRTFLLLFLNLLLGFQLLGQQFHCTFDSFGDASERLLRNRTSGTELGDISGTRIFIPVQVHMVNPEDTADRVDENEILDMMCMLNSLTNEANIFFYLSGKFNYIFDDVIHDDHTSTEANSRLKSHKYPNALNIFIVHSIVGNALALYNGPADSDEDFLLAVANWLSNPGVVPHAFGHFCSLLHTHQGWEEEPYLPSLHGNPVQPTAPSGFTETELMDGSNCLEAADKICDTPPDYNFLYLLLPPVPCQLNQQVLDPAGVPVVPMFNNIMGPGYNNICNPLEYSNQQLELIKLDLLSPERTFLQVPYMPDTTGMTGELEVVSPLNDSVSQFYNYVRLEWSGPSGAEAYIVQIDESFTFNFNPQQYVVYDQTFLILTDLKPDKRYYWRVRPFKELHSCRTYSPRFAFGTGAGLVSVPTVEQISGWAVMPNPLRSGEQLHVQMQVGESFEAELKMYNLAGQLVKHFGRRAFSAGANTAELNVNDLTAGMYFLVVETASGLLTEKVVLAR